MEYEIIDNSIILKVYYRKEHKYFDVVIDVEDLNKVQNEDLKIFILKGDYVPYIFNGKYYKRLQSYLTPNLKISYSKNRNQCDCRKSNITSSPSEVEGLTELKSIKLKEAFKNISTESRNNIIKGQRENRYTKDYSNKLKEDKFGEKNLQSVLTWNLVEQIRDISRNEDVSQTKLAKMFNISRSAIADIINYRTWTVKSELNERIYKDNNVKAVTYTKTLQDIEFTYDDISSKNILLKFQDVFLYIEKLSIDGLIYIEERTPKGKFLASTDVYIPKYRKKSMKNFYIIAKMNPRSKGRAYFYNFIDKAFNELSKIIRNC